MSVTTSPRTVETTPGGGSGYGDLDDRRGSGGPGRSWVVLVVSIIILGGAALGAYAVFSRDSDEVSPATTTTSAVSHPTEPEATTPTVEETSPQSTTTEEVEIDIGGWQLGSDDVPAYAEAPIYYPVGSPEGDVELGFVNGEIATIRALANPGVEEPELAYWTTGFSLKAARDTQAILDEDGQLLIPGPLTRIEIENITLRSDSEADVEYCTVFHDYSVVVDDPSDLLESVITRHAIDRLTLGPDGQWQSSEAVSEIQVVDGFGSCLDVELTPVTS